jgi:hypothetical protein
MFTTSHANVTHRRGTFFAPPIGNADCPRFLAMESSKQDAIPLDVRNQIDEICDKTNFQSISIRIQSISTRITTRRPPVNIVPKHNSTAQSALVGNQIDKMYDETNFQSIPTRITILVAENCIGSKCLTSRVFARFRYSTKPIGINT